MATNKGSIPEDEDPTKMLGGGRVLTISEVALLLEGLKNATEQRDPDAGLGPMMRKTKDYVDRFRTAKSAAVVQHMRDVLIQYDLSDHDMGSLANIMPDTPDEARALIPSLEGNPKLDDESLQSLLLDLKSFVNVE